MKGRYRLDKDDYRIIDEIKNCIDVSVEELLKRGVRAANIEIELVHHIKKVLKEE